MPGGRPSKFKDEFVEQATKLCKLGATDAELADFFNVNVLTIHRWKNGNVEFCNALKAGKEEADNRVERSLYQRAVGYTFDSEKVFNAQGIILRAPIQEHVAPDTTACIFWLKNRRGDDWRDKSIAELTGKDGSPLNVSGPTIIFTGAPDGTSPPQTVGSAKLARD